MAGELVESTDSNRIGDHMELETLCARDRHGIWCEVAEALSETDSSVKTACGEHIVLPHGVERRVTNCPACRAAAIRNMGGGENG